MHRCRVSLKCLLRRVGSVLLLLATVGCGSSLDVPDLQGIYDEVAKHHDQHRNPVVVIPGVLGTRLVNGETGQVVWGAFGGAAIDPEKPDGARLFAHPMASDTALASLTDEVVTDGVLEKVEVKLAGLPIELRAYVEILATLGAGGYRDETFRGLATDYGDDHFTCFQYPYDWRRDNVESAQKLFRFLKEKQRYVTEERRKRWGDDRPARFDVVAHSMGGLVLRYMLRYGDADLPADGSLPELTWAGAELVDQAILVGTPSSGSLDALEQLVQGRKFGPLMPRFESSLVGTLPSLYQLLPRPRHGQVVDATGEPVDFLDPAWWKEQGLGLADPDQDAMLAMLLPDLEADARRQLALEFLEKNLKRAQQFHAALDRPALSPDGTSLMLFVGDSEVTSAKARFDADKRRLQVLATGPGDGTVLRTSALMDERLGSKEPKAGLESPVDWQQVHFLFADHLGMTSDPGFSDNVLYLLLESPRR